MAAAQGAVPGVRHQPHKAYRAVRDGALDARLPAGQTRGLRCRRSEFVRWMEECLLVRA